MIAPLAISKHSEPIISIFDIANTANVAAKKHIALTKIDDTDDVNASPTASFLSLHFFLSSKYLVVIRIA